MYENIYKSQTIDTHTPQSSATYWMGWPKGMAILLFNMKGDGLSPPCEWVGHLPLKVKGGSSTTRQVNQHAQSLCRQTSTAAKPVEETCCVFDVCDCVSTLTCNNCRCTTQLDAPIASINPQFAFSAFGFVAQLTRDGSAPFQCVGDDRIYVYVYIQYI